MKSRPVFADIMIIGSLPPPVGGVSISNSRLSAQCKEQGFTTVSVIPSARSMMRSRRGQRARVCVLSVGRLRSVIVGMILGVSSRERAQLTIYLHGSAATDSLEAAGLPGRWLARYLSANERLVLVNNEQLVERWGAIGGKAVAVGSPASTHRSGTNFEGRRVGLVTFAYRGLPLYNAELCLRISRAVRESHPDHGLTIVLYGGSVQEYETLRRTIGEETELLFDVDQSKVQEILQCSAVLLRLTDSDGDSLVIREALEEGCPVVASDVVPRPSGVVTVPLADEDAIVRRVIDAIDDPDGPSPTSSRAATVVEVVGKRARSIGGQ